MPVIDCVTQLGSLLEKWEHETNSIPTLTSIAELVEKETEAWYKMDPDPFDDRHPGRADPQCALGHLLKSLFKNDNFMNKLVSDYLLSSRDRTELQTVACRLLFDIMPGLETSVVFQENEGLVRRLTHWAEHAENPLRSYATGLLAGAMEIQDIAANFKDNNTVLVPMMLKRLHKMMKEDMEERETLFNRPFANIGKIDRKKITIKADVAISDDGNHKGINGKRSREDTGCTLAIKRQLLDKPTEDANQAVKAAPVLSVTLEKDFQIDGIKKSDALLMACPKEKPLPHTGVQMAHKIHKDQDVRLPKLVSPRKETSVTLAECSSSSWAEMEPYVIGSYCMFPLTRSMEQRLIFQYLTPMGEYQELVSHVFEQKALELIFYYINLQQNRDVRLAFDALKYLAALLCHKKFAIEFITEGGVESLLKVYRPSVAATGVSMCLYYLAYFEDAMERVCMLPFSVLSDMVHYVLWLLECSHESGRCHATMFFSMAFSFRVILELFDRQDGLRKLFNVISTLAILNMDDTGQELNDDEVFTSRQAARHVCVAFKRYMEAHLAIKADKVRRSYLRSEGGSPLADLPAYKATKYTNEVVQNNIELLLECLPQRMRWEPVNDFVKHGGITLLLQLVAMAADWSVYTGKAETIKCALDTLAVCSVMPQTQLLLCDSVTLPDNVSTPAISIMLGLAEGEAVMDADVQRAALNVTINCVGGPIIRVNGAGVGRFIGGSAMRRKVNPRNSEDLLSKMWNNIRSNNGIMVLLKLLTIKTPITEADSVRALACKALVGIARCDTVKQIIGKLPLFNNGQLQLLMKEPVLQDKRSEHVKFCKNANDLIERVSGKTNANIDASLDRIRKADVVAQTKILYQEKELLQLIHEHLLTKGLLDAASSLQKEACLPRAVTSTVQHPSTPNIYSTPISMPKLSRQFSSPVSTTINKSSIISSPLGTPIKMSILSNRNQSPILANTQRMQQTKCIIRQKHEATGTVQTSLVKPQLQKRNPSVSLDKIVTEYLRKQHAVCKNPVVTCPMFSLLTPHRCPDPMNRNRAPTNFTARIFQRMCTPKYGGPDGLKLDRKYIYGRFRPIRSYRDAEEDGCFSCCAFSACEQYLMLGTYTGELKLYNIQTAEEVSAYTCHNSPLTQCQPSRDGKLVLTSSSWGRPLSALWGMGETFETKHNFDYDNYVEFSKWTQDRIIGTKDEKAHVYDVTTGRNIVTLYDPDKANNYSRNRATFNPTDDLVLNDGVLWDVNSGKALHKFDKFNPNISGVFHPMGQEIIINSEVWDLRTFRLLHTVPALDQCQIRFNHNADIIYGAIHQFDDDDQMDDETIKSPFGSSFRTFDSTDYSNIATIDVKKNIFDLCTDSSDCYLAVIENQKSLDTITDREESLCRLYEVGRRREDDEEAGEEDDEDDDEEDDMDGDDDDEDDDDDDESRAGDDTDGSNDEVDSDDAANSDSDDGDDADDADGTIEILGSSEVEDDSDDGDMEDVFFQLSSSL